MKFSFSFLFIYFIYLFTYLFIIIIFFFLVEGKEVNTRTEEHAHTLYVYHFIERNHYLNEEWSKSGALTLSHQENVVYGKIKTNRLFPASSSNFVTSPAPNQW